MKLGIHLSSFTPRWEEDIVPYIIQAAKIGYEAVEIPLMQPYSIELAPIKEQLRCYRLACTCGTGLNPKEDVSSPIKEVRVAGQNRLRRCIEICSELESDCLGGILYAPWGLRVPRKDMEERYKMAAEELFKAAEYGSQQGVTLSMEVLNRYESSFMNTLEEGSHFVDRVGHTNLKLHFDTFHAHIEETNGVQAIEKYGDYIHHVHLCDNNRAAPGSGSIDFIALVNALKRVGFNRYMMVENFVLPGTPACNEVCVWRNTAESALANAIAAYQYCKEILLEVGYL